MYVELTILAQLTGEGGKILHQNGPNPPKCSHNAAEQYVDIQHSSDGVYVQWIAETGLPDFFFLYGKDIKQVDWRVVWGPAGMLA